MTALEAERRAVAAFKKVALIVIGTAMQTYGDALSDEQEVLSYASDILIDVYAAESAVLRAERGRALTGSARGSPRDRGSRVRERRRAARRSGGEERARRDGRRRHACVRCLRPSGGYSR